MDKNIINTGTITNAIRGRDALRANGCKAYMFRKHGKDAVGCGYSVSTECNIEKINKIFNDYSIRYISIDSGADDEIS